MGEGGGGEGVGGGGVGFFFNDTATTEIYTLSLHDALPICPWACVALRAFTYLAQSFVPAGNFQVCVLSNSPFASHNIQNAIVST